MARQTRAGQSKVSDGKTKRARAPRTVKPRAITSKRSTPDAGGAAATARERKPASSPKSRTQRYLAGDERALRDAVRSECLKQFERRLGRAWDPQLERLARNDSERRADLREAFEVHEQLRAAMERALEFVKKPRAHAPPLGLGWWVPRFVAPLVEQDFLRKREPPARSDGSVDINSERRRLVAKCDAVDFIGAHRRLDATELAIVWLLGGGWPDQLPPSERGVTPSQVIQAEARRFRTAAREIGKQATRPSYRARFEQDETGRWSATVRIDTERTCVAEGATLEEAHQRLREALALLLDEEADVTGGDER